MKHYKQRNETAVVSENIHIFYQMGFSCWWTNSKSRNSSVNFIGEQMFGSYGAKKKGIVWTQHFRIHLRGKVYLLRCGIGELEEEQNQVFLLGFALSSWSDKRILTGGEEIRKSIFITLSSRWCLVSCHSFLDYKTICSSGNSEICGFLLTAKI